MVSSSIFVAFYLSFGVRCCANFLSSGFVPRAFGVGDLFCRTLAFLGAHYTTRSSLYGVTDLEWRIYHSFVLTSWSLQRSGLIGFF